MKVQATERGFYADGLREPGDVFDVEKDDFTDTWMEKVTVKKKPAATKKKPAANGDDPAPDVGDESAAA